MDAPIDKTALSYWFPKLAAAGLPVPKTQIIAISDEALGDIFGWFDGKPGKGAADQFIEQLKAAASEMGFPCFLRTDHTSAKHSWKKTCFVEKADDLGQHVFNIAEFSELCSIIGLPYRNWVVREMLPTIHRGVCSAYGDMPVCREFRFFVEDGNILCHHPYWPKHALEQGNVSSFLDYDVLCCMEDEAELRDLASRAGAAVGGAWSIDILETKRGWFITDMAEAHKSFHWEGCEAR